MPFIVLGIVLVLYLWMRYDTRRSHQKVQKEKDAFWNLEYLSNETRKKDISNLNYINIPISQLPFMETADTNLLFIQDSIKTLSSSSILNLTGKSNTDLKLEYGVANIHFLTQCDNNYSQLISTLYKWGDYLYQLGEIHKAKDVLEYAIACGSDLSKNYTLLATIYKELNTLDKIDELIHSANELDTLMKTAIMKSLKEIKNSIYLV